MKTGIHPDYVECKVHCSCGNEFTTRSTVPSLRVELCSECHPFYTGKQKLVDTGGRVERFNRRHGEVGGGQEDHPRPPRPARRPPRPDAMSSEAPSSSPRYMGGQAVVEGVMMRGERTWAIAVRTPEGDIEIETHETPTWAEKWAKIPLVRGVMALAESMALGMKALTWSANRQIPEEEQISSKAMGWTIGVALTFFTAIFIVLPAVAANGIGNIFGLDGFWFHVAEGALRLGIFLGYLLLIGQLKDIKRVFQYHGAEHKAIAAYENDVELTAESAQQFDTSHVRCGTNFLLTVMVITIVVYSFVGRPGLGAADPLPDRAAAAHRRSQLRGHPLRRPAHGPGVGARGDEARSAPAASHHASAVARPGRGGGGVAEGGAHRRAAGGGRGPPAASTEPERAARARVRVKFGIFYEHQLPRPWEEDSEYTLIQHALEQCELADRLGIDYVWEVEHHFLEEYSHSSAPEVFLAAASQRTQRIRLGHGIVQTPPPFNHPARVAERVAMLDLVSGGRADFGTGESSSEAELGGFGIDPEHKRAMWEEGLRVALRCMTETPFTGHAGEHVTMPPRNVVPKPVQKPHPPVWVACSRRDTIHLAAQKGIGALAFAFIDPEEARHWMTDYHETLANGVRADR